MSQFTRSKAQQYLFHLRALEYTKKHINKKIWDNSNQIQKLNQEINQLGASNYIPPPQMNKPPNWYAFNYAGKWIVILCITLLLAFLIFTFGHSIINGVVPVMAMGAFIIVVLYNISNIYKQNTKLREQYDNVIAQYNYEINIDNNRVNEEISLRAIKIKEIEKLKQANSTLEKTLEDIKKTRNLLYSVNYIPYQFRNLESISFFYSQIKSSPIKLDELIRYETMRAFNGYKNIPDFIKLQDEIYSFYTTKGSYFWDSCKKIAEEISEFIEDDEYKSEYRSQMEFIIEAINEAFNKGDIKMNENNFYGSVGAVFNDNHGTVNVPMSDFTSIENKLDDEILKEICNKLADEIKQSNNSNTQQILNELEKLRPTLVRKKEESKFDWSNRVEQTLQNIANIAGIAGFVFSQFFR